MLTKSVDFNLWINFCLLTQSLVKVSSLGSFFYFIPKQSFQKFAYAVLAKSVDFNMLINFCLLMQSLVKVSSLGS